MIKRIVAYLFVFLLITCSPPSTPEKVQANEKKCEHCKMGITDLKFNSQAVTKKGRRYHFDSIECIAIWSNDKVDTLQHIWVKDFYEPEKWILVEQALFLHSQKIASPMGGNLASFGSKETLQKATSQFGGESKSFAEVKEFLLKNR